MNTKLVFILLLIAAGLVVFNLTDKPTSETSLSVSANTPEKGKTNNFVKLSKTMGAVEVEVKPISVQSGKDVIFEVLLNTHSVELSYDYTKIVTLIDDEGNLYNPREWTGGNSGHHSKGELIFEPLTKNPKELTLILDGIDNETESFIWQL